MEEGDMVIRQKRTSFLLPGGARRTDPRLGRKSGISLPAKSRPVTRGRSVAEEKGFSLVAGQKAASMPFTPPSMGRCWYRRSCLQTLRRRCRFRIPYLQAHCG